MHVRKNKKPLLGTVPARRSVDALESRTLFASTIPSVGLYASLPNASETNPTSNGMGQFVIKRTGSTLKNLLVRYSIGSSSTAVAGHDFQPLSGTAIIKRGRAYVLINVTPIDDADPEPDRMIVGVVKAPTGFVVAHSKAVVTIHDNDVSTPRTVTSLYVSPTGNDNNAGTLAAPYKTLQKARDVVRTLAANTTDNLTVFLRGGEYTLPSTLNLDARDSGSNGFNVIWKAYGHETPIISGAQRITGWSLSANGVYSAPTAGLEFLQFYVGGLRATLARLPNSGSYHTMSWDTDAQTIDIESSDAAVLRSLSATQLHQVRITILGKGGNQATLRIASVSGNTISPQAEDRELIFHQNYPPKEDRPYFLDNALAFLDSPGEFYVDPAADLVYYKPRAGENLLGSTVATAPKLTQLVHIEGSLSDPVENIQFYGLTFQQTNWTVPLDHGFIGDQGSFRYVSTLPADQISSYPSEGIDAAIHLAYAHKLRFERNTVRDTGASAINAWVDVDDTSFVGNVIEDTAASGITIDLNLQGNPGDSRIISKNNVIKNNFVTRIGLDYYQSVGIITTYAQNTTIEHNEVTDTAYTGISVGWGWADVDNAARNNLIRYNKVHDVVKMLADGAGIYTLSKQPGTQIVGNYVYDVIHRSHLGSYPISGIYLDEGSDWITVKDNVEINIGPELVHQNMTGSNNTFQNNDGESPTTIANAGIEAAYRDIIA